LISGQKRGAFGIIKRLRRRSAIEAVIGHMEYDGYLGRCHLKGRAGDAPTPSSWADTTSASSSSG
jgi:transposase, IS5 family